MEKIRYGIIGYGEFAERTIAPAIQASPNSELVAIQKRSLYAAQLKAHDKKIHLAFDSANALVEHPDVDAVFIVSSNAQHASETVTAARAKKHVLVEKPMALNTEECRTMTDECRKQHVKLMVAHMVRLSPAIEWIKAFVHSGSVGRILSVRTEFVYNASSSRRLWLYDRKIAGGGPIYDIGVHCLDTIRYILDDEVVSVKSQLFPLPTENATERTGLIALRFSKGTTGSIFCSFETPYYQTMLEIVGTESRIELEDFTLANRTAKVVVRKGEHGARKEPVVEEIVIPNLYENEVTLFSECILNDAPSPIPGEEGLKNQEVLDQAMNVVNS